MYRDMARDGVKVFFEKPGPTTRESQLRIVSDPKIREIHGQEEDPQGGKERISTNVGHQDQVHDKIVCRP